MTFYIYLGITLICGLFYINNIYNFILIIIYIRFSYRTYFVLSINDSHDSGNSSTDLLTFLR